LALMVMMLCGCSVETVEQRPVTGATARIRIDDGLPIKVYPGQACFKRTLWRDEDPKPYSSPETYTVAYKVVKTSPPLHLGMPVAPTTPPLYNEYYVEAHAPVIIKVFYNSDIPPYGIAPGISTTCSPTYASFMPEAGKDYEIRGVDKGPSRSTYLAPQVIYEMGCAADINEIVKREDGSVFFKPVFPGSAAPCD
jgi:hypothetical protein